MNKLRLPAINAPTVEGKLDQIRSYLFQLTEYINQLPETGETAAPQTFPLTELTNAVKNKIQNSFIHKTQLETEDFALRGSLNGLHLHSVAQAGEQGEILLQTKFSQFSQGYDYQMFFLFGIRGGAPFQRVLRVDQTGSWMADESLEIRRSSTQPGTLVVLLETPSDRLAALSPEPFRLE